MRQEKSIICNRCGKRFWADGSKSGQESIHVEKEWGYFSSRDGIRQVFDLCESCYDEWISSFRFLPENQEETEFL